MPGEQGRSIAEEVQSAYIAGPSKGPGRKGMVMGGAAGNTHPCIGKKQLKNEGKKRDTKSE